MPIVGSSIFINNFIKYDNLIVSLNAVSEELVKLNEVPNTEYIAKESFSAITAFNGTLEYFYSLGNEEWDIIRTQIIDYLDKIIARKDFDKNYNTSDVKTLRASLSKYFNAKKASELKN